MTLARDPSHIVPLIKTPTSPAIVATTISKKHPSSAPSLITIATQLETKGLTNTQPSSRVKNSMLDFDLSPLTPLLIGATKLVPLGEKNINNDGSIEDADQSNKEIIGTPLEDRCHILVESTTIRNSMVVPKKGKQRTLVTSIRTRSSGAQSREGNRTTSRGRSQPYLNV